MMFGTGVCRDCYFVKRVDEGSGYGAYHDYRCHRFPPTAPIGKTRGFVSHEFPMVQEDDWCGEFVKLHISTENGYGGSNEHLEG